MLTGFFITIFVISTILCMAKGGTWDNLLTWVNCLIGSVMAMNFYEGVASSLEGSLGRGYQWFCDFLGFWLVYCATVALMRLFTDTISKVRVRIRKPFDTIGSGVFSVLIGWQMVCLATFSMHMAPLALNSWEGAFQEKPDSKMFMGLGPDVTWLSFIHKMSKPKSGAFAIDDAHQFDPDGLFRLKHGVQRYRYENVPGGSGTTLVP